MTDNEINRFMIKKCFQNNVICIAIYTQEDIDSDHNDPIGNFDF